MEFNTFTIKCNKCGHETEINSETKMMNEKFGVCVDTFGTYELYCENCDNEVKCSI